MLGNSKEQQPRQDVPFYFEVFRTDIKAQKGLGQFACNTGTGKATALFIEILFYYSSKNIYI